MLMGKSVGTSDKGLREAALCALGKVYQATGCDKEKVWKYFGGKGPSCKLPPKNQTMIVERLKRIKPLPKSKPQVQQEKVDDPRTSKSNVLQPPQLRSNTHKHASTNLPAGGSTGAMYNSNSVKLDMKNYGLPSNAFTLGDFTLGPIPDTGAVQPSSVSMPSMDAMGGSQGVSQGGVQGNMDSDYAQRRISAEMPSPNEYLIPTTNPYVLALDTASVEQRTEAVRQIWLQVQEKGAMVFIQDADALVKKVADQITSPFHMRLCKYALNTLMEFWQNIDFAGKISFPTLKSLTKSLLETLLDQSLHDVANGDKVMKAINVLTLKVLENAKRTHSFGALLDLLSDAGNQGTRQFTDLIVKCLRKLTKVLGQTVEEIDLDNVLSKINSFFVKHPAHTFQSQDDIRFRTVRRLLVELVNIKGEYVRSRSMLVTGDASSTIVRYCDQLLGRQPAAERPNRSLPGSKQQLPSSLPKRSTISSEVKKSPKRNISAVIPTGVEDDGRTQKVAMIFKSLHQTDTAKQALEQLYNFKAANPSYDLTPHLEMVSKAFQAWIQRGFKRIEDRKSGTAPSTGSAAHFQERLRALRARAAQIKGSSYGSLSYGQPSPPRPVQGVSMPDNQRIDSLDELRNRFNGIRGGIKSVEEAKENQNSSNAIASSDPATDTRKAGIDSIRARLASMRAARK